MISFIRSVFGRFDKLSRFGRFGKARRVPDPGQRVVLQESDRWRSGYRAVSEPITAETGEVVILVAEEEEFRAARWEGRFANGEPWPVSRITVLRRDERRAKRRARRGSRRDTGSPSKQGTRNRRKP